MKFKRYVKLRKYVNGVATDEYKKGELIAVVEYATKEECENSSKK